MTPELADTLIGCSAGLISVITIVIVVVATWEFAWVASEGNQEARYPLTCAYIESTRTLTKVVISSTFFVLAFFLMIGLSISSYNRTTPPYSLGYMISMIICYTLIALSFMIVIPVLISTYVLLRREDNANENFKQAKALLKGQKIDG